MRRIALGIALVITLAACSDSSGDATSNGPEMPAGTPGAAVDAAAPKKAASLGRAVIRTADLAVRVDDIDEAARLAVRAAETAGGYLESENSDTERRRVTLRVPPEDFTVTTDAVSRLGTVERRNVSTEDVTNDVADVDGRLKAARASVTRVRDLMNRASTIAEITSLESELNEREAALESLETRQRTLAGQTSYATVTATFTVAPVVAKPKAAADPGFTGGLRAGWGAFTGIVRVLLVMVGALLPFAAAGALVGVPLYLLLRRRRVSARA